MYCSQTQYHDTVWVSLLFFDKYLHIFVYLITHGKTVSMPCRAMQTHSAYDWCEPNYVYTEHVAEFWNSASST